MTTKQIKIAPNIKKIIIDHLTKDFREHCRTLQTHKKQLSAALAELQRLDEEYEYHKEFPNTVRQWVGKDKTLIVQLRNQLIEMGVPAETLELPKDMDK